MGRRILTLLTNLAIDVLALVVVDWLFDGIKLDTWQAVVGGAILLALVNSYLRPLIVLLTLPFNILSLGLFTFVINSTLLKVVSWILPDFYVTGFWTAVGAAFVISFVSVVINWLLNPKSDFQVTVDPRLRKGAGKWKNSNWMASLPASRGDGAAGALSAKVLNQAS